MRPIFNRTPVPASSPVPRLQEVLDSGDVKDNKLFALILGRQVGGKKGRQKAEIAERILNRNLSTSDIERITDLKVLEEVRDTREKAEQFSQKFEGIQGKQLLENLVEKVPTSGLKTKLSSRSGLAKLMKALGPGGIQEFIVNFDNVAHLAVDQPQLFKALMEDLSIIDKTRDSMVNRQQQFNQATGRLGNVRSVKDLMAKQLMTLGLTKRMSLKEKLSAQGYTFLQFKGEWGKMFKVNFLKMKKSSGDAWDKTTAWFTKEALGCNLLQLTHENDKLAKFVQNAIETQIMTYQEALDFHEEIRKKIFEGEGRGDKGLLNKAVAKIEDGSEWRMFLRKDPAARKLVVCINIIRDEKAVGEISRKIHSVLNEGEEAKESKFEKKFWDLFNKITKVGKKPVVGFLMGKLKQRFTEVWVDFMLEKAGADEKSNGWSSIARRDIEKQVEAKLRLVVDGFSV